MGPFPAHAEEPPLTPEEQRAVLQALERIPILEEESTAKDQVIAAKDQVIAAKDEVISIKDQLIAIHKETSQARKEQVEIKTEVAGYWKELYGAQKLEADAQRTRAEKAERLWWVGGVVGVLVTLLSVGLGAWALH